MKYSNKKFGVMCSLSKEVLSDSDSLRQASSNWLLGFALVKFTHSGRRYRILKNMHGAVIRDFTVPV